MDSRAFILLELKGIGRPQVFATPRASSPSNSLSSLDILPLKKVSKGLLTLSELCSALLGFDVKGFSLGLDLHCNTVLHRNYITSRVTHTYVTIHQE